MAKHNLHPRSSPYLRRLRIIGGEWRGRWLEVIESEGLRPTPDRVRETVFNWLQPIISGARCLDLFAGTGALCLEALSRGAEQVVMVEKSRRVADVLRRNIARLDAGNAQVIEDEALAFLKGPGESFDIVFVDPPFRQSHLICVYLQKLKDTGRVQAGGKVYIEAPADIGVPDLPEGWTLARSKTAGQVGYHLISA